MSTRASDEFHALVIALRDATDLFNTTSDACQNEDVSNAFSAAITGIETTALVATTYESAIAAIRLAKEELSEFNSSQLSGPLVRGALAYFEKAEASSGTAPRHAMDMASGLSLAGIKGDTEWLAIYDAIDTVDEIITAFGNRPACISDNFGQTAAGEYLETISDFLAWERCRIVDAMRIALENTSQDPERLHKGILAHDVKYSEFGSRISPTKSRR